MTGPGLPEGSVNSAAIGEAYSDIASIDAPLSAMQLSHFLQPIVTLPQKPPPARSGFMPGIVGTVATAQALNFSSVGVGNIEQRSRQILLVKSILITNQTGAAANWDIRRVDGALAAFTIGPAVPLYIDAGTGAGTAIAELSKNNAITVEGAFVARIIVPDLTTIVIPLRAVINNGGLIVSGSVINQEARAAFVYDCFPIIHPQAPG